VNVDEIAALQALIRSLGWKIVQRELGREREQRVRSIMSRSTSAADRHEEALYQAGMDEALGWPARMIDRYIQQSGQPSPVLRAGVGPVSEE
jgi:predicted solute-binding protein